MPNGSTLVDPSSDGPGIAHPPAPRLASLRGTRGGLRQIWQNFDVFAACLGEMLSKEHQLAGLMTTSGTFVERKGDKQGRWQAFTEQVDWAVLGLGTCWGTAPWTIYDAIDLERRGVPTVSVVTNEFAGLAKETAIAEGYPDLAFVLVPHFFEEMPKGSVTSLAREKYTDVVAALTSQGPRH